MPGHTGDEQHNGVRVNIEPLAGQTLYLLHFLESFFECALAHEKHEWLQRHRVVR